MGQLGKVRFATSFIHVLGASLQKWKDKRGYEKYEVTGGPNWLTHVEPAFGVGGKETIEICYKGMLKADININGDWTWA